MRHDWRLGKYEDLTGQIFGDFEAIAFDNTKGKYKYYWICKCIHCGFIKSIATGSLKASKSINCNSCNKNFGINTKPSIPVNIVGQKFGGLTVVEYAGSLNHRTLWKCECECGNIVYKTMPQLKNSEILFCEKCYQKFKDPNYLIQNRDKAEVLNEATRFTHLFKKEDNIYTEQDNHILINGVVLIDKEDLEFVKALGGKIRINSNGYAVLSYFGEDVFLHRAILGLPATFDPNTQEIGEHKNGNRLDNTRQNLRICKKKDNAKNCTIYKNNTVGYKGVTWLERIKKYQVDITVDGKTLYLGVFQNIEDAIDARIRAEKLYYGEFRREERDLFNTFKKD